MLAHKPPDGAFKFPSTELLATQEPHPERPERVQNIKQITTQVLGEHIAIEHARSATVDEIATVHDRAYIDWVRTFCEDGGGRIENTTTGANERTFEAARYACGAAVQAARRAVRSEGEIPYALVRPPGHHAQSDTADGFCFFNNTAVAAEQLLSREDGIDSVAIVD